ncbi:MAG: hypothetical protein JJU37_12645 [Balneolaceae bacterium]|nr:hypothetical protein [Balneolaceae bacterium]
MRKLFCFLFVLPVILSSCSSNDRDTYRLTITPVPQEAGSVTPANAEFDRNRSLEISATANEHWVFSRWEGDYEGTENPVVITIDSDKDIAAVFEKRDYPLTLLTDGEGQISERIVQQRTTEYPHGTTVELTAEPAMGWEFLRWEGDLDGNENPAIITIDGETEVTAVFSRIEYPLTINIVGEGEVDEEVIQMKTTDYPDGTVVQLTAIPEDEWAFSAWSGDASGADTTITITINEPKEVTATFLRTFLFTPIVQPEEGGEITPEGGRYVRDTSFEVTAEPNQGWRFTGWEGDFTGTTNPFSLTMNGNKTVVANFERLEFLLDITTEGEGIFTTSLLSGTETATGFLFGSEVEIQAFPQENWRFVGWGGDVDTTANPLTISIDDNLSIVAIFSIFEDGDGSEMDPYQISNAYQLQFMNHYLDANFLLVNDIDATTADTLNSGAGFNPVGSQSEPFTGSLNGNNYTIADLEIDRTGQMHSGLFGVIDDGRVENLALIDARITGGDRTGAIAGENRGEILNSYSNSGEIIGTDYTGGLAGINQGIIEDSYTSGTVDGNNYTGGLSGDNSGQITSSYFSGNVEGNDYTGGVSGSNNGTIFRAFASGTVDGNSEVGGLAGRNHNGGLIDESHASSSVNAVERVGGLVGSNGTGSPIIRNSYSRGRVTSTEPVVGGLVGNLGSTGLIEFSYSTGSVNGPGIAGGLIGLSSGTVEGSYWNSESSGQGDASGNSAEVEGATSLTTEQMQGEGASDEMSAFNWESIWMTTTTYPILIWQDNN